ncbi:hypothetical protein NDU88_003599 [Pleurodeles waltl]|uniref:Uncharacterized protein n=1 Tax=Pleurodeles waltl TaxID=8319 RepID=A0AAV7QCJ7_PLEWA|nr:hypothetical protein NDU88_003599 [Pleurodeles waltl]
MSWATAARDVDPCSPQDACTTLGTNSGAAGCVRAPHTSINEVVSPLLQSQPQSDQGPGTGSLRWPHATWLRQQPGLRLSMAQSHFTPSPPPDCGGGSSNSYPVDDFRIDGGPGMELSKAHKSRSPSWLRHLSPAFFMQYDVPRQKR